MLITSIAISNRIVFGGLADPVVLLEVLLSGVDRGPCLDNNNSYYYYYKNTNDKIGSNTNNNNNSKGVVSIWGFDYNFTNYTSGKPLIIVC